MQENEIMKIKDIHKTYGTGESKVKALNGISFNIYKGELLVIFGSSGSGKSTLLNLIGGMDKADSGQIIVPNGKNICEFNDKEMTLYRRNSIGFVFQSFNLISELTVKENIAMTANITDNSNIIDEVLEAVGLLDKKDKYPFQLSGGEQQRVSIARALAKNTDILLCDEPTGALDYKTGKQILIELEKLCRENGKTVIIVTHTREIGRIADRIITMRSGEIINEFENNYRMFARDIEW